MRVEDLLDLARKELLATAVDHFLEPADDADVARGIPAAGGARAEPTVGGEKLGVRRGILVIAEVHRGAFGRDLALGAGWYVATVLVDEAQLHTFRRAADGAGNGLGIVLQAREGVKAGLEHAVELDQVAGDARAERADGLDGARGAARDDDAQRPQVETLQPGIVEHRDE